MSEATVCRETRVVNVKVAHIRPKYANLKAWMADPDNVYIGRGGIVFIDGERFPKTASKWANPYKVGAKDGTREEVIEKYKEYAKKYSTSELLSLQGKTLGCWCKPESCHGDWLAQLAESANKIQTEPT